MSENKDLEMVAFACPSTIKDTIKDIASTRGDCSYSSVWRDCVSIGVKTIVQEINARQPGQVSMMDG